ncbi:MAG: hypothetical protein KKD25_01950 [Gammaproteobacteria bacterium]|nr:hypothetical protein [Gammaproteobacteria bacterium]MBU0771810.1 hypothetical protein [Gammaproteobacteria bacterium]MBU0855566.1 hypothetical protein [Gammaproteobacteria bacterium]MBU1846128.1 hypothetical protein [Gammaproteobacteria bacterium]
MIASLLARALPPWALIAVVLAIVSSISAWGWIMREQRDAARADHAAEVARFAEFRARVESEGRQAQARTAAEITRQETINAQTHTAYGVALDRLRALHAADRLRIAASAARTSSGGVPADAAPAGRADAASADDGSAAGGRPAAEAPDALTERCAAATLQCAWLQHWIDEQTAPVH